MQDVIEACKMIDEVVECVKTCRRSIDIVMVSWYEEILHLADNV